MTLNAPESLLCLYAVLCVCWLVPLEPWVYAELLLEMERFTCKAAVSSHHSRVYSSSESPKAQSVPDASNNHRMVTAYIALGSNVGDRFAHLQAAVDRLGRQVRLTKASHVYETAPMYVTDQPPFLNAAVQAQTSLSPAALLAVLKGIETETGRQARPRYGPREVDLDLIAYGNLEYTYTKTREIVLHLPHPKTGERRFVLQPLFDLEPNLELKGLGSVQTLLTQTEHQANDLKQNQDAVLSI